MSYEELVESRKNIGDMTKEELFTYCGGLLSEVWDYEKENEQLHNKVEELMTLYTTERNVKEDYKAIIKEVREYIEKEKSKLPLGRNDFTCEMVYSDEVVLANELLEILDKEDI